MAADGLSLEEWEENPLIVSDDAPAARSARVGATTGASAGGPMPRAALARAAAVAAGAAVAAVAVLALLAHRGSPAAAGRKESLIQESADIGAAQQTVDPGAAAKTYDPLSTALAGQPGMPAGEDNDASYLATALQIVPPEWRPELSTTPPEEEEQEQVPNVPLAPATCATNEEELLGLCYMKCELLTNGTRPFRTSPYQCCETSSTLRCILSENATFKFTFPGSGFDVDGQGGVPHPPGRCLENEENFLSTCYLSCSHLTFGEYPIRSAPFTCCKQKPCYNIFHVKTSGGEACTGYGVGGGNTTDTRCPHKAQTSVPIPEAEVPQAAVPI